MFSRAIGCIALCVLSAHAQVSILNGGGKRLSDLAGTDTYITVVLKESNARDTNLRIKEVLADRMTVESPNGEPGAYLFDQIREVRVQLGKVAPRRASSSGVLTGSDLDVAARADARVFEVLGEHASNQSYRMQAAALLAASAGPNAAMAVKDLNDLADSNDLPTQLEAGLYLYLAGQPVDPKIVGRGISSGNRAVRASAIRLAGFIGDPAFSNDLVIILKDPSPDTFTPAARAAGQIGDRKFIPDLLRGLTALNDEKAEACVDALTRLGGPEVIGSVKDLMKDSKGSQWFRMLRVRFALGDEEAIRLMKEQALTEPSFRPEALLLLAEQGDWDASVGLREQLAKSYDANIETLAYRARAAAALILADHPPAKSIMQEIFSITPETIYIMGKNDKKELKEAHAIQAQVAACMVIARSGARQLMPMLAIPIGNLNPKVALAACQAALSLANPEYRERLMKIIPAAGDVAAK